ncbi:TetR/AcrR family transcriptional regulator [Actinomadura sp. 9N407]|uniref:TetR/AcrR family transcriptional regulator n=1 Tax=Actinomadura sp. 9N407 TaxID=3375154 RepID=UPI0037AC20BD
MTKEDAILSAATRRLNEDPTVSMSELAQAIGISRATLYRHIATREALLHKVDLRTMTRWERIHEEIGLADATATGDSAVLAATLRSLMRGYLDTIDEYGFMLTEHFLTGQPDMMAWVDRLEERELAFIAAAQRAGVLRAELPPRSISDALYGLLLGTRDGLRRGNFARRDAEELLATMFLRGAGAPVRGTR